MLKTYADRIKFAMEKQNISSSELVRRTGLNKGAISSYINDRYNPKQEAVYLLAKALNVSAVWLMGLSEDMNRTDNEMETDKLTSSQWGDDKANIEYFKDKPELLATYLDVKDSDNLVLLFDKAKDLEPEDIESVLNIVISIRKSKGME